MAIRVAGAPVSFGVFELTEPGVETVGPDEMVDLLAEAGYGGIDLGPAGFLGEGAQLRARLARSGLALAGGWVQLPFADDDAFAASLPQLDAALRLFSDAAAASPGPLPLPTLADDGSAARRAAPGRGREVDPLGDAAWARLVANVARAAELVRAAGFDPTFHHHAGTFVESPEEIDRFLSEVDIGFTLDSGHLILAGGDPLSAVRTWGHRINHLHLKDVDRGELARGLAAGGGMREVWSSPTFVRFGAGDVDLAAILDAVTELGFDGWIVVEQDVLNGAGTAIAEFRDERADDQRANLEALRPWLRPPGSTAPTR